MRDDDNALMYTRIPTEEERDTLFLYYEKQIKDAVVIHKRFSWGSAIIAGAVLIAASLCLGKSYLLLGFLILAFSAASMCHILQLDRDLEMYRNGAYNIEDGQVNRVDPSLDWADVSNVHYGSSVYAVKTEGASIGTPLLIVHAKNKFHRKNGFVAFTPSMIDAIKQNSGQI